MKLFISILPVISIIVINQLIVKWRITNLYYDLSNVYLLKRFFIYITDPWILITYILVFISSLIYMFVLEKYPISLVYPVSIGMTVLLVNLGGIFFLSEVFSFKKFIAILLITSGLILISSTKN